MEWLSGSTSRKSLSLISMSLKPFGALHRLSSGALSIAATALLPAMSQQNLDWCTRVDFLASSSRLYRGKRMSCSTQSRSAIELQGTSCRTKAWPCEKALAILADYLQRLPPRKMLRGDKSTDWGRVDGYRVRTKDANRYVLKREVFNATFATEVQRDLVLQHLIGENQITLALRKGGVSASATPKKQFKWPDGQRRRSYEIVIPRS
jgi:hypothetical protein